MTPFAALGLMEKAGSKPGAQILKLIRGVGSRATHGHLPNRGSAQRFLGDVGQSYAPVRHPAVFDGANQASMLKNIEHINSWKGGPLSMNRDTLAKLVRRWRRGGYEK